MTNYIENNDNIESLLRFQVLVEKSLVGVYMFRNGKFVYANSSILKESGYTEQELYNLSLEEFIYSEDLAVVKQNIQDRLDGKIDSVRYEARVISKTGDLFWVEMFGTAIPDSGSKAIIGTIVNITDKKRAFLDLAKSEADLRTIFETSEYAFLLLGNDLYIRNFNEYFRKEYYKLTGIEVKADTYLPGLLIEDCKMQLPEKLRIAISEKRKVEYELCFDISESIRYFYSVISPVISNGEVLGVCYIGYDNTHRKLLELENQRIIQDLAQRNTELERFNYTISHSVRAPVATILGLTALLKKTHTLEERIFVLEGLGSAAQELDAIITDLNNVLNTTLPPAAGKSIGSL